VETAAIAAFEAMGGSAVYRVTFEALEAAGVPVAALDPDYLAVHVDGEEVATFMAAYGDLMGPGDALLFYADSAAAPVSFEIVQTEAPLWMGWAYAAPSTDAGDVWAGSVDEAGMLAFETCDTCVRYLLVGFGGDQAVHVFDVTDPVAPILLFGFEWLGVGEETGLYLSYPAPAASCIAVEDRAVIDVESVRRP
jgi:hypothetical protein